MRVWFLVQFTEWLSKIEKKNCKIQLIQNSNLNFVLGCFPKELFLKVH